MKTLKLIDPDGDLPLAKIKSDGRKILITQYEI